MKLCMSEDDGESLVDAATLGRVGSIPTTVGEMLEGEPADALTPV
jgi:DNA mismatch repair protein MutH